MGAVSSFALVLVAAVSVAGCYGSTSDDDDDGGDGSCGAVQACGGDVVGTWDIVDVCATVAPPADRPECANAVRYGEIDATGQMEFTADGQAITTLELTMQATFTFTEACVSAQAGQPLTIDQAACDAITTSLSQNATFTSTGCTLSNHACVCPATFHANTSGNGTYTLSGTNLIDEDGSTMPYCVDGTTLRFSGVTDAGSVTYVLRRAP